MFQRGGHPTLQSSIPTRVHGRSKHARALRAKSAVDGRRRSAILAVWGSVGRRSHNLWYITRGTFPGRPPSFLLDVVLGVVLLGGGPVRRNIGRSSRR